MKETEHTTSLGWLILRGMFGVLIAVGVYTAGYVAYRQTGLAVVKSTPGSGSRSLRVDVSKPAYVMLDHLFAPCLLMEASYYHRHP